MKKAKVVLAALMVSVFAIVMSTGCAIVTVEPVDDDTVVVAQQDTFLFGLLNEYYVCDVTGGGLSNCASNEP